MSNMDNCIESVLFSEEKIAEIVKNLGEQISKDYNGKKLLLVSVLKGSVVFMADLMRNITIPCEIDFMVVSSYGAGTKTSGNIKIIKDLNIDIADYDLLIVEDILDSGVTLSTLKKMLEGRKPASIKICTFLDKPERRKADIKADYCGFSVPDEFIVGYGLDFDEKFRNLPYVGVLKRECYEK
ncbi:MAG: hypoxanthine phosphoribosyltransferase [Clostridia bacterium]|nr:hypoxanthine phosphoribosyltransferase [Clostridia bacterium]